MKKVVLISCVSKKLAQPAPAQDLYISPLFKLNLEYAKKMQHDHIFVLSGLYGLTALNQVIAPYDVTLNDMKAAERKVWANSVIEQINEWFLIPKIHFVFLAGKTYGQYLVPHMPSYSVPMEGLGIGKQLQFLKQQLGR